MIKPAHTARWLAVTAATLATTAALATALITTPAAATSSRPSAVPQTPMCSTADLEVWVAADQMTGAAGTLYYPLEFTNISKRTCTLYGHPGVSAVNSMHQQLGNPAAWASSPAPHTVRLAPAATGYALLGYGNAVVGSCPAKAKVSAYWLRVIPPDQTKSLYAFWPLPACTATRFATFLGVRVIAPGIGLAGSTG